MPKALPSKMRPSCKKIKTGTPIPRCMAKILPSLWPLAQWVRRLRQLPPLPVQQHPLLRVQLLRPKQPPPLPSLEAPIHWAIWPKPKQLLLRQAQPPPLRLGESILSLYFVQAGAFRTPEDAEAQKAKLSMAGFQANITEREQSGRTVFRVRIGPVDKKEEADKAKEKLDAAGFETAIVRVQR